jgi:hypothetical protein
MLPEARSLCILRVAGLARGKVRHCWRFMDLKRGIDNHQPERWDLRLSQQQQMGQVVAQKT